MLPFNIRDGLLIIAYLVGAGIGITVITRNEKKIGGYVLAGFLFLMIDPVTELIIFNFLATNFSESIGYDALNWVYACTSTPAVILGISALLAAIYFALNQNEKKSSNEIFFTKEN